MVELPDTDVRVRTSYTMDASPRAVWPLLCNSAMELPPPLLFWLGIPRPTLCRLPSGVGGVGERRECVSDQGSIQQRILEWKEQRRLCFEMTGSDMVFLRRHVRVVVDSFDLDATSTGRTRITRTTEIVLAGRFPAAKAMAVYLGLKIVHRYVFKNWGLLARKLGGTPCESPKAETPSLEIRPPRPAWVRLGLWRVPNRVSAVSFMWLSFLAAGTCLVLSVWDRRAAGGIAFAFAALWYLAAIRWVDRNGGWNQSPVPTSEGRKRGAGKGDCAKKLGKGGQRT